MAFKAANVKDLFECRGGGIGRRKGLKILRVILPVPVRVRPSAPAFAKASAGKPPYAKKMIFFTKKTLKLK